MAIMRAGLWPEGLTSHIYLCQPHQYNQPIRMLGDLHVDQSQSEDVLYCELSARCRKHEIAKSYITIILIDKAGSCQTVDQYVASLFTAILELTRAKKIKRSSSPGALRITKRV
jgi:hypothetical protein